MILRNTFRRFPNSIAALALLAAPLGCGSDTPATPDVATPTVSSGPVAADPFDKVADKVDKDVRQTAGTIQGDLKDVEKEAKLDAEQAADRLKGDEKKAADDAKARVKAAEDEARKSAEGALDSLLGNPK